MAASHSSSGSRSLSNADTTRLLFSKRDPASAPALDIPGKRIILCFEGTGHPLSKKFSNVLRFFDCLVKNDPNQKVYYHAGIGIRARRPWKFQVDSSDKLDAAFAWNLVDHVQDGYRFLMDQYEDGDKISLFGFSRGAYTARVLAAFVQKVGLLPRGNESHLGFAWDTFMASDAEGGLYACADYKKKCSIPVLIDFVGVWDTVASLGISGRELPLAVPIHKSGVRVFRQALALDERRAKFTPNFKLVSRRNEHRRDYGIFPKTDRALDIPAEDVREVWFAGCHSDVGGGSVSNETRNSLARIPLRWMVRECFRMKTGIKFEKYMLTEMGFEHIPYEPTTKPDVRYQKLSRMRARESLYSRYNFSAIFHLALKVASFLLVFVLFPLWYAWYVIHSMRAIRRLWARFPSNGSRPDDIEAQHDAADDRQDKSLLNECFITPVEQVIEATEEFKDVLSPMYDQLHAHWCWWIFEVWPLVFRMQYSGSERRILERRINFGTGRKIYGDAWNRDSRGWKYIDVHESVFTRIKFNRPGYRPRAWFPLGDGNDFHWQAEITGRTTKEDLERLSGWDRIRWVD